jgi:hypothetical protein
MFYILLKENIMSKNNDDINKTIKKSEIDYTKPASLPQQASANMAKDYSIMGYTEAWPVKPDAKFTNALLLHPIRNGKSYHAGKRIQEIKHEYTEAIQQASAKLNEMAKDSGSLFHSMPRDVLAMIAVERAKIDSNFTSDFSDQQAFNIARTKLEHLQLASRVDQVLAAEEVNSSNSTNTNGSQVGIGEGKESQNYSVETSQIIKKALQDLFPDKGQSDEFENSSPQP